MSGDVSKQCSAISQTINCVNSWKMRYTYSILLEYRLGAVNYGGFDFGYDWGWP